MTVKAIIELETANTNSIYLLKEGIFYHAYNRSAMRLVNHIQSYKVHGKWVKKAAETIYYCGFPQQSFEKVKQKALINGYSVNERNEKQLVISGITANDSYEEWQKKQIIANQEQPTVIAREERPKQSVYFVAQISNGVKEEQVKYSTVKEMEIIDKLRAYPLENATPIETMLFVQQLKQLAKDGIIL